MACTLRSRIGEQIERNYKLANAEEEGCKVQNSYGSPDFSWDPASDLISSSGSQSSDSDNQSSDLPYPHVITIK
jgi:hypothetical protein